MDSIVPKVVTSRRGSLGRGAGVLDGARTDDLHRRLDRRVARREPRARDGGNHALLRRGGKRMALVFGEHQHELAAVTRRDQHVAFQARIACDSALARRKSFVNPSGSSARPNGCMRPVGV